MPAPVLFTTNCLMPPKASYADRVFTTATGGLSRQWSHIGRDKNFRAGDRKGAGAGWLR